MDGKEADMDRILEGKKVAVLVETEYIPEEINFYQTFFTRYGAQVDYLTQLWGQPERYLVSDVDSESKQPVSYTHLTLPTIGG